MRSHYCGQINSSHIDQEVELCGWVHRRRDHGGVIFIDLRDREGLVQVVFDPDDPAHGELERVCNAVLSDGGAVGAHLRGYAR